MVSFRSGFACIALALATGACATLTDAMYEGDVAAVRQHLRKGADPNKQDGDTLPLCLAIIQWNGEAVSLLLEAGARSDLSCGTGEYTPKRLAVNAFSAGLASGKEEKIAMTARTIRLMLAKDVDFTASMGNDETLFSILQRSSTDTEPVVGGITQELVSSVARHYGDSRVSSFIAGPSGTPAICAAARGGNADLVKVLLPKGAGTDTMCPMTELKGVSEWPLVYVPYAALQLKSTASVRGILEANGARPNESGAPLSVAAIRVAMDATNAKMAIAEAELNERNRIYHEQLAQEQHDQKVRDFNAQVLQGNAERAARLNLPTSSIAGNVLYGGSARGTSSSSSSSGGSSEGGGISVAGQPRTAAEPAAKGPSAARPDAPAPTSSYEGPICEMTSVERQGWSGNQDSDVEARNLARSKLQNACQDLGGSMSPAVECTSFPDQGRVKHSCIAKGACTQKVKMCRSKESGSSGPASVERR